MRLGILIIGSLYWDRSPVRCRWRWARLGCTGERKVRVPIRYGRISKKRGNTYTMVFANSCAEESKLGIGIIVPARAECCGPEHLIEEVEHLWAAEQDDESLSGFHARWGKVCILPNPQSHIAVSVLNTWKSRIDSAGPAYSALRTARGETPVLDPATGRALFSWPMDNDTKQPLQGFDLLLMTANEPCLVDSQYAPAKEIAKAWRDDKFRNVNYFFNNTHFGITTFEDDEIRAALWDTA